MDVLQSAQFPVGVLPGLGVAVGQEARAVEGSTAADLQRWRRWPLGGQVVGWAFRERKSPM